MKKFLISTAILLFMTGSAMAEYQSSSNDKTNPSPKGTTGHGSCAGCITPRGGIRPYHVGGFTTRNQGNGLAHGMSTTEGSAGPDVP